MIEMKMCPILTAAIWEENGGIGIEPCRGIECMYYEVRAYTNSKPVYRCGMVDVWHEEDESE